MSSNQQRGERKLLDANHAPSLEMSQLTLEKEGRAQPEEGVLSHNMGVMAHLLIGSCEKYIEKGFI